MFKIKNNKISMTRGDTLKCKINVTGADGQPYIPSPEDKILFAVKRNANETECLFKVDIIPTEDGTCILHIKPEDTKNLEFGTYKYDVSITLSNGDVHTFIEMTDLTLTEEIG